LAVEAQEALRAASALEQLIDLACEARDTYYFRSEDPVAAAGFVVSDAVAALWTSTWERHGFQAFAEMAAPQLIRWESRHGWTRHGWTRHGDGAVTAKETTLTVVLARMLRVADTRERALVVENLVDRKQICTAIRPNSLAHNRRRGNAVALLRRSSFSHIHLRARYGTSDTPRDWP
jgi:hypothetical protein